MSELLQKKAMTEKEMKRKQRLVLLKAKRDPVFFAEHFLIDPQMKYYTLEEQQKSFLRDKNKNRIFFCSRRSGKTLTLIIDLLHKAFFNRNQSLGLIAPTLAQATEFANVMNDMILRSPMISSSFIVNNKFTKQLTNLSRISFKTAGAKSGQAENSGLVGSGYHVLYLDEIQSMDAASLGTILPVITGQVGDARLCFSGTPRGRSGFFWDLLQNAFQVTEYYKNNGKPMPLKENGKYSLHRYQVTELDENDNVMYSRAEYRLPIDELETIKETIGVEMFKREYCLEFLDSMTMPFYSDLIDLAFVAPKPQTFSSFQPACAGIDFGKKRNISALTIAVQTPQQTWEAKYYKRWRIDTKYNEILHYVNNILPKVFPNLKALAIDHTGVGTVLTESINHDSFYEVLDIIFSQPSKVSMVEGLVSSMENQFITFYPDKLLQKEMSEYTRETTENDRVIYTKGESDDCLDSAMLCNVAINHYIQNGSKRSTPFKMFTLGTNALGDKNYQNKRRRDRYTKKRKRR